MTARNWILVPIVISAYLWTAGWLVIGHWPAHAAKVEPKFYPLDGDEQYTITHADCGVVTRNGHMGLLCTDKGEGK